MIYERETIKDFIKNYHTLQAQTDYEETEDDFFSLDKQIDAKFDDVLHSLQHVDDMANMHDLLEIVDQRCTDKEFFIFLARCHGLTYQRIGNIFSLQTERIRQIVEQIIDKLSNSH